MRTVYTCIAPHHMHRKISFLYNASLLRFFSYSCIVSIIIIVRCWIRKRISHYYNHDGLVKLREMWNYYLTKALHFSKKKSRSEGRREEMKSAFKKIGKGRMVIVNEMHDQQHLHLFFFSFFINIFFSRMKI